MVFKSKLLTVVLWILFFPIMLSIYVWNTPKISSKKTKIICIVVIWIISLSLGVSSNYDKEKEATQQKEEQTIISIDGDSLGDYGKEYTYNEGTDSPKTVVIYNIPTGTYEVTNEGEYTNQLNVYSDETTTTEEGWEEPADAKEALLIDSGETEEVTIEDGYHIEVTSGSDFKLVEAN